MNPQNLPASGAGASVSIVCGLPGSGKTCVVKRLPTFPGHLWVEADAWSPPEDLAWSAELLPGDGPTHAGHVVAVIAADTVWGTLRSTALSPVPQGEAPEGRTIADVLVAQIEWASIVVVSRVDLVSDSERRRILELVRLLNPLAFRLIAVRGDIGPVLLPRPTGGLLARVHRAPGWVSELNRTGSLPTRIHGLGCVTYRDPRPFHPARLAEFFAFDIDRAGEVHRSRGLLRLASRIDIVGSWSSAGPTVTLEPTGMNPADPESAFGQELVFFGTDLDDALLRTALDACLLSDEEFLAGPMAWQRLPDPFPAWDLRSVSD